LGFTPIPDRDDGYLMMTGIELHSAVDDWRNVWNCRRILTWPDGELGLIDLDAGDPGKLNFGHGLSVGSLGGQPTIVIGKQVIASSNPVHGEYALFREQGKHQ
jgi:hypothetical protein